MAKRCYECKQGARHDDYDDDIKLCAIKEPKSGKVIKQVNLCFHHRVDGDFVWDGYIIEEIKPQATLVSMVRKKAPVRPAGVIAGSPAWITYMDELIRHWTGWDGLQHMCSGNPTLMITKNTSPNEAAAIREMREAYKFINGKDAYPAQVMQ